MVRTLLLVLVLFAPSGYAQSIPRTADGKPFLQGIWQVQNRASYDLQDHGARQGIPAGRGVVDGAEIPYQPWAAAQKQQNFENRATADPLSKCYMPGVPRIMYMEFPFHIFQTPDHVAMTFEWSQIYRLIYTNGLPPKHPGIESWMGNSRGRWEGDTLVIEVTDHNDKTWFDMAGNFHSEALKVTERYTLRDADTIQYEATIEDPKVFTRPWKISMPLHRQKDMARILEYQCQAEAEETNGAFERDPRTWYPAPVPAENAAFNAGASASIPNLVAPPTVPRMPDGRVNITGYFQPDGGGANYGLERHERDFLTPAGRGVVIDPADGTLPYQEWARRERIDRELPHRGYDDPTAHCFVAGVPRSHYTPSPFFILQPPGYVVILFERMSWRTIPLDAQPPLPSSIRLWQGNSVGRWQGDTLIVESSNFTGKTWLNEVGDMITHAQTVTERITPVSPTQIVYRATVSDPLAYTRPWTIEIPWNRQDEEILEVACHEDNNDLHHLKDVRDEFRANQRREN